MVEEIFDMIIVDYRLNPKDYNNNPWRAYEACKKEIRNLQNKGKIDFDSKSYNECIEYISEKLSL